MKRFVGFLFILVIGLFLTFSMYNCGGGGGDSSNSTTTSSSVSGVAFDGPVSGATVKVYKILDNGSIDFSAPIATTLTNSEGKYSFSMNYSGPVYIVVSGGKYFSPIDNKTITLDDNLTAALPEVTDNTSVAVTPLTTVAAEYAKQVGMTKDNIKAANHTVAQAFLGDDVSIAQVLPSEPNSFTSPRLSKLYGTISEAVEHIPPQDMVAGIQQGKLPQTIANKIENNISKVTNNSTIKNSAEKQIDNAASSGFTPPPVKNAKLIVKTGFEGLYVSVDDPKTLKPVQTKLTNSKGIAEFNNLTGPYVVTTIAFTPDFVVNKKLLMWYAIKAIQYDNSTYDIQKAFNGKKVSVKDLESIIGVKTDTLYLDNATVSKSDVETYDNNGDGYLDENELYSLFLNLFDANGDGKLEFKEINKEVNVEVIINCNTPLGDYNVMQYYFHWKHIYEPPKKVITLRVLDIPPLSWYEIKWPIPESDYNMTAARMQDTYLGNSDNSSYDNKTIQVPLYCLQDDGTYSAVIRDGVDNKYAYILNSSSDNVTVNLSKELRSTKDIKIQNLNSTDGETYVNLYGLNRGASYQIGVSSESSTGNDVEVADIPFEQFSMHYGKYILQSDNKTTIHYGNDVLIPRLPNQINANNFTYMTVKENDNGTFLPDTFSNTIVKSYLTEGINYYDYSTNTMKYYYRFKIEIIKKNKLTPLFSELKTDNLDTIESLLPPAVANYIREVNNKYITEKSLDNTYWNSHGYSYIRYSNAYEHQWFNYDYNDEHN